MDWVRRYRWALVAGALSVVVGVGLAVVLWPSDSEPEPRARVFRDYDVCVLMSSAGLSDPQAAAVWGGVQDAASQRAVRASYQRVLGEQTVARADEFLGSLVQQDCEVIVAVGQAPVAAAVAAPDRFPSVAIVSVGHEIEDSSADATRSSALDVVLRLVPER